MQFKTFGDIVNPTVILLHGGGLSWWAYTNIIDVLKDNYYIITPIIDGHGECGENTFVSIEDCADKLIEYVDINFEGRVFAMTGLSIGAQILCEILSKRERITSYAIIESALVLPIKYTKSLMIPSVKVTYPLIKYKWFAKMQAKTLNITEEMFEEYYKDSLKISKESLINITLSNGTYSIKEDLSKTKAKVLIIVGEKEIRIMKKSAYKLNEIVETSEIHLGHKMSHGELSLQKTKQFISLFEDLVKGK